MASHMHPSPVSPPSPMLYSSSGSSSNAVPSASLTSESSVTPSQMSDTSSASANTSFSSASANTSYSDSCDNYCPSNCVATPSDDASTFRRSLLPQDEVSLPPEQRQNPRRTTARSHSQHAAPPALVREVDRRVGFVDGLVDAAAQMVEAIWPLSSVDELGGRSVLPLRTFIQETLRRARTSYSTLQVALYYLILIKPSVPSYKSPCTLSGSGRVILCGRRMFLAALILSCKYLQDRNFSAGAWSRISGLSVREINRNELAFLFAVDWKLHVTDDVFQRWTEIFLRCTSSSAPSQSLSWKQMARKLDPGLTNIDTLIPRSSPKVTDLAALAVRSILNAPAEPRSTPTPHVNSMSCDAPAFMEPQPMRTCGRPAPLLNERLAPLASGFFTPAASVASRTTGLAMPRTDCAGGIQGLDRLPHLVASSPQGRFPTARRTSLANSVSSVSSPESTFSAPSRSRSASFSSASSLASATHCALKPSVPSRSRAMEASDESVSTKSSVLAVPQAHPGYLVSSGTSLDTRSEGRVGEFAPASGEVGVTVVALDERQKHDLATKSGRKRSRNQSADTAQHLVRAVAPASDPCTLAWLGGDEGSHANLSEPLLQMRFGASMGAPAKRVCYAAGPGAVENVEQSISFTRRGTWDSAME
ncbi:hypothetical protein DCS_00913 [Drechmeria coniospora]|uniref:G1/S-specific cyclin Pcl5 n=1 Tax=Drechmeria coniospora TaxID=98403 RepID=A0A151GRP8_DRECN|nr:hypothetical protein DCS_00913 [Drechmeria coniospora]KYK59779.1 hypothetical protein DCS_00913 [Drechmeria coniospora]